jgi:hypothetical protein
MTDQTPAPAAVPAAAPLPHPFKPVATGPSTEIADPVASREFALADSLIAGDPTSRDKVIAAMKEEGHDAYSPDDRTADQRSWDEQHGVPRYVDPQSYVFELPKALGFEPAVLPKFNDDLREVASDLGLGGTAGSAFIRTIIAAATGAATNETGLAAAAERHDASIRAAVGDRYAAMAKTINELLDDLPSQNKKLTDALRPGGILSTPMVFGSLHARAQTIQAWNDGRPS